MTDFVNPANFGAFEAGLYGCRVDGDFDENGRKVREETGKYGQEMMYRILLDRGGHKKTVTRRNIAAPYPTPIEENPTNDAWCDGLKGAKTVLDVTCAAAAAQAGAFPVKLPGVPKWSPAVTSVDSGGPGGSFPAAVEGTGFDAATAFLGLQWVPGGERTAALEKIRGALKSGGQLVGGLHAEQSAKPVRYAMQLCAKRQKFKGCFPEDWKYESTAEAMATPPPEELFKQLVDAGFTDVKVREYTEMQPMFRRPEMAAYLEKVWACTARPSFTGDDDLFAAYLVVVASEIKAVREMTESRRDHHFYDTFATVPAHFLEFTATAP